MKERQHLSQKDNTKLKLEVIGTRFRAFFLSENGLNQDTKLICISTFIFFFGDGMFTFLLPVYIRQLDASPTDVGLLYALAYLICGITVLLGGFLADRFDAKKIMIMSYLLWIPVPLAFAFANNWHQLWLPMILYGTFFEGPTVCFYFLKSSQSDKLMSALAMWSLSTGLAYISSPFFGGFIASTLGKQMLFLIASVFYGASIFPIFMIRKLPKQPRVEKKTRQRHLFNDTFSIRLVLLTCFFAIIMFDINLIIPFIPQFTNGFYHQSIINLGVFGMATSIGWVFFSAIFGKIGDKRSKMSTVVASLLVSSFSYVIIILFNNFSILFAASFLSGASSSIVYFMPGIIGSAAPEGSIGKWISISEASVPIAAFGAPILGGMLYEISPYLPFYTTIIVLSLLAVIGWTSKL